MGPSDNTSESSKTELHETSEYSLKHAEDLISSSTDQCLEHAMKIHADALSIPANKPSVFVFASEQLRTHPQTQSHVLTIQKELASRGLGMTHMTIEQLLEAQIKRSATQSPILVVLSETEPDSVIHKIIDRLCEHLIPALVLVPESKYDRSLVLRAEGIMCEPNTIDPKHASLILWTLAERQPAIQQLALSLHMSELTINSVHSEINKLHEELASAASIQREYMPKELPRVDGLDMGIVYRPASYVSGDIYDIIELDEDHTGFFLADAVGHGVPAALMTMVITQGLHKVEGLHEKPTIIPPSEALRRLNNTMTEHTGEQARFATAVYAIYNKRTNEITIAGAGHPPSLLIRSETGEVEHLESEGPLLGVFPDVEFGQHTIKVNPGDVFILYSDGFEVAFPNENAIGDDRKRPTLTYLKELADAGSGIETLQDAIGTLEEHLDQHNGSLHQPDDITAMFIAFDEQSAPVASSSSMIS